MKIARTAGGVLVVVMMVASALLGGCQRTLFTPSDGYTRSRIDRYYGGDSAIGARETRSHASEMGFGFPTGMANQ